MSKFAVRNLDKTNQVEVRIYQINKAGSLVPVENFVTLDGMGLSTSVQLKPDYSIDCTGAFNYIGNLQSTITAGTTLTTTEGEVTAVNSDVELVNALQTNYGLDAVILENYIPLVKALTFKIKALEYDRYLEVSKWTLEPDTVITVDWGDGSPVETFTDPAVKPYHDYPVNTTALCKIRSNKTIPSVWFWGDAVTEIVDFGEFGITNPKFSLETLTKVPTVLPTFITDMSEMFYYSLGFTGLGVSDWDTSHVTKMGGLFGQCDNFNQPLNTWNVSNVTEMWAMFDGAALFNQPLDTWDVSKVTNMFSMLKGTTNFNQNIGMWDTSSVVDMGNLFYSAEAFNQDISNWNVSNVTNMNYMFRGATAFNSPLDSWNVSKVTNMFNMFTFASSFNQPLGSWNVSKVTDMINMFYGASLFNQDISQWCVGLIPSIPNNFNLNGILPAGKFPTWGTCPRGENIEPDEITFVTVANNLNYQGEVGDKIIYQDGTVQNITNKNIFTFAIPAGKHKVKLAATRTSGIVLLSGYALTEVHNFPTIPSVNSLRFGHKDFKDSPVLVKVPTVLPANITDLSYMFHAALIFNQDISTWDVSNVTHMEYMFRATELFNQPIGSWDISSVVSLKGMFNNTYAFNQPLNTWDVSGVTTIEQMFSTARAFDMPLDTWNTSTITNMSSAFGGGKFNQPINMWDVSNVTLMASMFAGNSTFNQPLNNWNVSKVTSMNGMFNSTYAFNQDISMWNVSNVADMNYMFNTATNFAYSLVNWCVPNILSTPTGFSQYANKFVVGLHPVWGSCPRGENIPADEMHFTTTAGSIKYQGTIGDTITYQDGTVITVESTSIVTYTATAGKHKLKLVNDRTGYVALSGSPLTEVHNFPTLSTINHVRFYTNGGSTNLAKVPATLPSNITNLSSMFRSATNFNGDISAWNVSNVTNMENMFMYMDLFNQNISGWDVSNVTNMTEMFYRAIAFNQAIGGWNTSKVAAMGSMFYTATAFKQSISQWCVGLIPSLPVYFYESSGLVTLNLPVWGTCPRGENQV